MKLPFAILLTVAGTALTATAAEARDGCHRGYERHYGRCVPIRGGWDRGDRHQVWVVGRYYNGRGWWDGRRWYQNRYRHHGGWRYR
jgi:hypothetical protein